MRVEQLLHGYSDGHRLLAASTDLPRTARHLMLTLSDMSGRSMSQGFEEYLTAYPVRDSGCYAFAKTWYAPEMERPGCVWTHTLLIQLSDVGGVSDLSLLLPLFRRPSRTVPLLDRYDEPLVTPTTTKAVPTPISFDIAVAVLSALYGTPSAPVLVPVDNSNVFQDLAIAIWNQQWPALRSTFSLCTGSIASRSIAGRPLDLQLIPHSAVREVQRDVTGAVLVERGTTLDAASPGGGWLLAAARDLARPNTQIRSFLNQLGGVLDGRAAFAPLVDLSLRMPEVTTLGGSLEDLVEVIGEHFPVADEGQSLKSAILGQGAPISQALFPNAIEVDLLRVLATTGHEGAFDPDTLNVDERIRRLWSSNQSHAERLVDELLSRDHNTLGELMLTTLVSAVPPSEISAFFSRRPAILISAVRRDPELAAAVGLWSAPSERQRELFDAVAAGHEIGEGLQGRIVKAMLTAGSDAVADQVLSRFGETAAAAVLDWIDGPFTQEHRILPVGWRRPLGQHLGTVLKWLVASPNRKPTSVALAAQLLDPHSVDVHRVGLSVWLTAIASATDLSDEERTQLYCFSLALAFDLSGDQSCELAVLTFEAVHDAAGEERLRYDSWRLFEDWLPFLSPWRNWDKCERLRRGLVRCFEKNEWPVTQFVRCARTLDTFSKLLRTCKDFRPEGERLFGRMWRERDTLRTVLSTDRWDALRYYA